MSAPLLSLTRWLFMHRAFVTAFIHHTLGFHWLVLWHLCMTLRRCSLAR